MCLIIFWLNFYGTFGKNNLAILRFKPVTAKSERNGFTTVFGIEAPSEKSEVNNSLIETL